MLYSPAILFALLAVLSPGLCHIQLPAEGESCTELVRRPEKCAEPETVTETVEPVDEVERFGPNVCVTETTATVSASEYVVKRSCRRWWFGLSFCGARCVNNNTCSVRNITSRVYDCCPGYGARSSSNHGFGYGKVNRHPGLRTLLTDGCTVELRESVADCLSELGLTSFQAAIDGSALSSALADMDREFTVFAPTNEAIGLRFLSQRMIMTHVLDEVVRNSDLRTGVVLRPLNEETLLHVTDVFKYGEDMEFTEDTFINGAQLNTSDACLAENGIVHTLKSIIPFSPDSIAELLAADPQFSDFVRLLDAANITQYLQANRNTSRTVFAPTNDAFAKLPEGAVECLLRPNNSIYAAKVVLTHITAPAEYTSTLSQRRIIKTFFYFRLLVSVINDTIHLTRAEVPLDEVDIPARNGVIHTLQSVLLPDCINYDRLCPPPPPPPTTPTPPIPIEPSGGPVASGDVIPPPELPELNP